MIDNTIIFENPNDILNFVSSCEYRLLGSKKVKVEFTRRWAQQFLPIAGLYVVYDTNKPVYFGETGNLKERMKDLKRTLNHSFRRSLGFHLYGEVATSKKNSLTKLK